MVQWLTKKSEIPTVFWMGCIVIGLCLPLTKALALEPSPSSHNPSLHSKTILVAGNGPERYFIEELADAFEQRHPLISIDFFWHENAKPVRAIQLHEADIAITGKDVPSLRSTTIARDGIAVLTNFSNPIKEMTTAQLADVFSGKLRYWSQVYEEVPQTEIVLVNRSSNQNIRTAFEQWLKIPKGIPRSVYRAETEKDAITRVSGNLEAITFVSMAPALRAKEDGVAINILFINTIEPEVQTVLDKRYPIQRPVMFVTSKKPTPEVLAFEQFVLSQEGQRLIKKSTYYPLNDH